MVLVNVACASALADVAHVLALADVIGALAFADVYGIVTILFRRFYGLFIRLCQNVSGEGLGAFVACWWASIDPPRLMRTQPHP